jgi:hypothetical protein
LAPGGIQTAAVVDSIDLLIVAVDPLVSDPEEQVNSIAA